MKNSSAKLNPVLRFVAAGTLLIWLSAVVMCRMHCCGDDCQAGAQVAPHNGMANSHDRDKDNHHDDLACLTLKSAVHSDNGIAFARPNPDFVHSLASVALVADEMAVEPAACFRQQKRCDRAFTPEVCLGPALHSLAPPALA